MTPEPFDGWTPEGLGIALRMSKGDLARTPRRRWWLVAIAALLGCLAAGALALLAWRWPRDQVSA